MMVRKEVIIVLCALLINVLSAKAQDIKEAITVNDYEKVEMLIKNNPSLVNVKDDRNCTPLHYASEAGNKEIVLLLISNNAEIDAQEINRNTPLHFASMNGYLEIAKLLLDHGADINAKNKDQYTPLHFACWYKQKSVIRLLIKKGANIYSKEYRGATPMMMAIWRMDDIDIVRLFIKNGADINVRIEGSWVSPIALAAQYGYEDIVNLLIDEGAYVDEKSRVLLRFSAAHALERLFGILNDKGTDLNVATNNGGTLIHYAAEGGSVEIIKTLIEKGFDCNMPDRYGWTPLHYAALNGHKDAVEMLLNKGTKIDARIISGKTACNIADEKGFFNIVQLLASKGADISPEKFPELKGNYLGQIPPGGKPEIFAVDIVSSPLSEHGCVMFSPDGKTMYWTSEYKESGSVGAFKVFSSHVENNRWTKPRYAFFTGDLLIDDDVPFVSPDGTHLIFMSKRPINPESSSEKEHYWIIDKTNSGWSEPKPIPGVVGDMTIRWQISMSRNGALYFGSTDAGGRGSSDIYMSRLIDGEYSKPENLGTNVNTEYSEGAPFIAPDESYLIVSVDNPDCFGMTDLFISFKDKDNKWTRPKNMGETINSRAPEGCPYVSPDGNYLFFNSGRNGNYDIYWVDAKIIEKLRTEQIQ
ncbi:MAG: ankyrin repeat domain-containing protein [Candidatus Latescibacteria bacterium]|nr:ankyrin repeat domain-containing protein [Candidatus Latescibacterota bacterium]